MAGGGGHSPFAHVKDAPYFETSETVGIGWRQVVTDGAHEHEAFGVHLPEIFGLQLSKFMVLQVLAALIVLFLVWGLSRKIRSGRPVTGSFWNFWEAIVVFLRNEVVRPTIGHGHHHGEEHGGHEHSERGPAADEIEPATAYWATEGDRPQDAADAAADRFAEHEAAPLSAGMAHPHMEGGAHPADKYLPFVATVFLYILVCNLLGMIPWLGSPTGEISVTGALAACTLVAVFYFGIREMGPAGFAGTFCPSGVPKALVPLIWVIEVFGLMIKHFVLAVRLFANIMAGHAVLAVFLSFIAVVHGALFYVVAPASVLAQVGISLLELFVAFLQAYVFAFLATLFIASAVHEH